MQKQTFYGSYIKVAFVAGTLAFLQFFQGCSQPEEDEKPIETLPMQQLTLENLEAFQPVAENWSIAGGVESNRQVEHDLRGLEGTGVLINKPAEEQNDHLFTAWEHGDLELELDFLIPKGSNSGIYLMGRYEIQLFDSWGVEDPQYSDVGGIYRRRDESRPAGEKEFEGRAPLLNAARAPGLWQRYKILFRAPEFNQDGEKIANAKFEEVWLNGALIHEDVEVTGPTIEAPFEDEQATGPLMIQGDHGPVAIRNIAYKRYDKKVIGLTDLKYEYYGEEFDEIPDFGSLEAGETGSADSLAGNIVNRDDRYALLYTGTLDAPNSGTYLFKLQTAGTVRMLIDDEVVFEQDRPYRMHELQSKTLDLGSGRHNFRLEYINHPNNWYRGLALFAEGPRLRLQKLHASSSVPGGGRELPDLIVEADDRIKVLRSFAMHEGTKRTHVVNTGAPNGINYSYDMGQAALLHAWEGPFVNTNEMWINRGEPQIADPAGPPITFDGKPAITNLNSSSAVWPDSISWEQLKVEGYDISEQGWPVFKYSLDNVNVEDYFEGTPGERRLTRTVRFKSTKNKEDFWFQLASGKDILRHEDEYIVDDRTYYLRIVDSGDTDLQLVQTRDSQDLRIPILNNGTEAVLKYEIIW